MVLFLRKSIKVGQILQIILVETKKNHILKDLCGKFNLFIYISLIYAAVIDKSL